MEDLSAGTVRGTAPSNGTIRGHINWKFLSAVSRTTTPSSNNCAWRDARAKPHGRAFPRVARAQGDARAGNSRRDWRARCGLRRSPTCVTSWAGTTQDPAQVDVALRAKGWQRREPGPASHPKRSRNSWEVRPPPQQ